MATNYVQDGSVITFANTGSAISAGDVVVIGANGDALVGIAQVDIAATSGTGTVMLHGVFEVAKVDAAVITQGETLTWDSSVSMVDDTLATPAAGDVTGPALVAYESKGVTAGKTIKVLFTGIPGTLA